MFYGDGNTGQSNNRKSDEGNSSSIMEPSYTVSAVTCKDGTKIVYRQYGHGPGVILVMEAMGTAHNYDQLAGTLATDFTVYVPDRRGRGMSPREYSPDHSIQKELENLDNLLSHTGAHFVLGLSSGAVIALEASRILSSIHKTAFYEPPFYLDGMSHDLVARFDREVGQGKLATALVTASKIVRLGPALLKLIPRPLLELATSRVLRSEEKKGTGKYPHARVASSDAIWPQSSIRYGWKS
jgi:pimeloyl-ACP methyl ester carboxylesterase